MVAAVAWEKGARQPGANSRGPGAAPLVGCVSPGGCTLAVPPEEGVPTSGSGCSSEVLLG